MCLAVPAQIVEILDNGRARAVTGEVSHEVDATCVLPESGDSQELVGEWVLVHVGFAMNLIDEQEAWSTLALLDEMIAFNPDEESAPLPSGGSTILEPS